MEGGRDKIKEVDKRNLRHGTVFDVKFDKKTVIKLRDLLSNRHFWCTRIELFLKAPDLVLCLCPTHSRGMFSRCREVRIELRVLHTSVVCSVDVRTCVAGF
jgi:hypothetical protein